MGARFSAPLQTGPGSYPASCTMGTGSFPGVKRPGRGADHPPPSKCRGQERVGLYLYSPSGPSWPVIGSTFLRQKLELFLPDFQSRILNGQIVRLTYHFPLSLKTKKLNNHSRNPAFVHCFWEWEIPFAVELSDVFISCPLRWFLIDLPSCILQQPLEISFQLT